jgi:hypothetical protein
MGYLGRAFNSKGYQSVFIAWKPGHFHCCVGIWIYKEPPVSILKLFQNQRTTNLVTSKTLKNHWVSGYNQQRTSSFMASHLIFQNFWELWWYARNWWLIFLRTMVMNPDNHPGNCWVSVPVSNNCPTLVIFLLGLLLIPVIWLNNGPLK